MVERNYTLEITDEKDIKKQALKTPKEESGLGVFVDRNRKF